MSGSKGVNEGVKKWLSSSDNLFLMSTTDEMSKGIKYHLVVPGIMCDRLLCNGGICIYTYSKAFCNLRYHGINFL